MSKMNLTEATMLALQGKLPMRESKATRKPRNIKKTEAIDVNVDDKTNVSVLDNETIVDTEEATIIVDKKQDSFVPETNDIIEPNPELPVDSVEVPIEGNETIIPEDIVPDTEKTDISTDEEMDENKKITESQKQVDDGEVPDEAYAIAGYIRGVISDKTSISMSEFDELFEKAKSIFLSETDLQDEYLENEVRGILSHYGWATIYEGENEGGLTTENKKIESVEIEVSDDGKEVEVTTDNGEEVEVKDETPDDVEEPTVEDELDENKKLQEDISAAPFRDLMYDCLQDDIEPADVMAERMLNAWSDDDCKWYCETYELVEQLPNGDNDKYYKDLWGNIRDISGQIVGDEDDLEEAKHRKIESVKKIESRIKNRTINKKQETRTYGKSTKVIERKSYNKCDLKSFTEALTKFYNKTNNKVENVNVNSAYKLDETIKINATLTYANGKNSQVCLEMKQDKVTNNFTKYSLTENKSTKQNLTMMTYTNKNNVLECRYINKV